MKLRQFAVVGFLLLGGAGLVLTSCGKKEGGGSSGDGDGNGSGDGDGDGDITTDPEPVIDSAPPAWALPSDCKGVGNTCNEGCQNPDSACQLEGNICIPGGSLRSQTAETPYCASYTCMTFDEASCYCLGTYGVTRPDCASPEQLAGLCGSSHDDCESASDCCEGMACIPERYSSDLHCREACETDEDCASGCCNDSLDTGVKICSDARFCETACKLEGETDCTDGDPNTPSFCCRGSCIETDDERAGCRPRCEESSECESNCCLPFTSGGGYCAPSTFCDESGEPPGGSTSPCNEGAGCAEGEDCVLSENEEFAGCQPACDQDDDCASGCCLMYQSADGGFCVDALYCSCVSVGEECTSLINCCEGSRCIGDGVTYQCVQECTSPDNCESGCCIENPNVGSSFCEDAVYCGL